MKFSYERYLERMIDKRTSRSARASISVDPHVLEQLPLNRALWFETEEQIKAGLAWGKKKAMLLRQINAVMGRVLTPREKKCLELRYFGDLTFQEIGDATRTDVSSAHRAVRRALRKLLAEVAAGRLTDQPLPASRRPSCANMTGVHRIRRSRGTKRQA